MTDKLWGEPLARELARDLAGTRVVPLAAIEPDLDPNVHHTNLPYAIISDRHTIAIVEGQKIAIDGPQRTNNSSRYATTAAEVDANRAEIAHVAAAWGIPAPPADAGVVDTALSIMRFLKQRGAWFLYVTGDHEGIEGHIRARSGTRRWPGGLHLRTVENGIRLTCGASERDLRSLAELADFAAREGAILDAQLLWCTNHVAQLAKLRPFGEAVLEAIRRVRGHEWSLVIADEYFPLDAKPTASIVKPDTRGMTAVLEPTGDAVTLTIGTDVRTLASPADATAQREAIAAAVEVWLATPDAEPPVRDMSYYR